MKLGWKYQCTLEYQINACFIRVLAAGKAVFSTYKSSHSLHVVVVRLWDEVNEQGLSSDQKLLHFFVGALIKVFPCNLLRPPSLGVPGVHDPAVVRIDQVPLSCLQGEDVLCIYSRSYANHARMQKMTPLNAVKTGYCKFTQWFQRMFVDCLTFVYCHILITIWEYVHLPLSLNVVWQ